MKTCWEVLGIKPVQDADAVRQAYLAQLPSFHPENDPQGFKQLRQAYETALQEIKNSSAPIVALDTCTQQANEMLSLFRDLLTCNERRFQPHAWQKYIQQLNTLTIKQVEILRWPLYAIAQETWPVSYTCLRLLAERLGWGRQDGGKDIDSEALGHFLNNVQRGDIFDFSLLQALPAVVQDHTIEFYSALEGSFFNRPAYFAQLLNQHGATIIPDDRRFQRRLLQWYSSLQWNISELIPVAEAWRKAEPENSNPQYFQCLQRIFCGEGDTVLSELCALWQRMPSTQMDILLLQWCRRHRPDDYPLVVLVIEKREQGNDEDILPGNSARTRLLWAEALHSDGLPPLSRSFVMHRLNNDAPQMEKVHRQHPRWPYYQLAECLASGRKIKTAQIQPLMKRRMENDLCPLDALIIDALTLTSADEENAEESAAAAESAVEQSDKTPGGSVLSALKTIFYVFIIIGFIAKLFLLFTR